MSLIKRRDGSIFPSMNTVLENFFNDDYRFMNKLGMNETMPAVNVSESDDAFMLEVAAPGLEREDFKVEIENGVLTIESKKEVSSEKEEKNYTRKEYGFNFFTRTFRLPENTKVDEVDATYDKGVLTIKIPKTEITPRLKRAIAIG